MSATATIRTVAAHAGVSVATVSAVMNGTKPVSPELTARVRASVTALDYRPNNLARSLKQQRSRILGLVISDITNPFFTTLVRAVEDTARARGYMVLLGNTDEQVAKEETYVGLLRSRQVDGLILVASAGEHAYLPDLLAAGFSVVCVDRSLVALGVDSVLTDNVTGAREAVAHLIALGHRRVGIVAGLPGVTSTYQRLQGYHDALAAAGIAADATLIRQGNSRIDGGMGEAAALFDLAVPPTALFVTNNLMTIGAMRTVFDRGLRCPEDLALIGFDDFEWASVFRPRLTTVRQPFYEIGAHATRLLVDRIERIRTGEATERLLRPTLVVRESCGEALALSSSHKGGH